MKLQRYDAEGDWIDEHTKNDNGDLCLSVDVEKLEAELDALHAECDRLTALLGKPKVLEAHEVTESGHYLVNNQILYLWRYPNGKHWDIQPYEPSSRRWIDKLPEGRYTKLTIGE